MRSLLVYLACIAALVAAGVGYAKVAAGGPEPSQRAAGAQPSGHPADWLKLHVQVDGLYPGQRRWAPAQARNRTSRPLTLRSVRPEVHDAGTGCTGFVTIQRRELARTLPPHSVRHFRLRVVMDADAVDACQGVKLRVSLRARATLR